MEHTVKEKKCANKDCSNYFLPKYRTDRYCCYDCAKVNRTKTFKKVVKKPLKAKIKKKKTKTLPKWIGELTTVFNRYIRFRDCGQACISCDRILTDPTEYDAGHFWPVRKYAGIRFHEHNVNGQCKGCNGFGDGMVGEYRIKLIAKIGQKSVDELEVIRRIPLKLSIPEVQELIKIYEKKLKEFE